MIRNEVNSSGLELGETDERVHFKLRVKLVNGKKSCHCYSILLMGDIYETWRPHWVYLQQ
jgi:hypothetical protein